jgi:hypothetical protein
MIDCYLNFRATAFSSPIQITNDSVIKLTGLFSKENLLPNIINQSFNIPILLTTLPININIPILELKNKENTFIVRFSGERIDILKIRQLSNTDKWDINEYINTAKDQLARILDSFSIKFKRIAFGTSCIMEEIGVNDLKQISSEIIKSINFYSEHSPMEWNIGETARIKLSENSDEFINIISNISINDILVNQTNNQKSKRIKLDIDINTIPENTSFRFDTNGVNLFKDKALSYHEEVTNEYLNCLFNE